eukprot:681483-Amphidinium_carterae.1
MRDKVPKILIFLVFLVTSGLLSFCSGELLGRLRWYNFWFRSESERQSSASRLLLGALDDAEEVVYVELAEFHMEYVRRGR